jgi:hypothetical protein
MGDYGLKIIELGVWKFRTLAFSFLGGIVPLHNQRQSRVSRTEDVTKLEKLTGQ